MNVDTMPGTGLADERITRVVGPTAGNKCKSLIGLEELRARPHDVVILFQDEDTARCGLSKFGSDFVCVSMRPPYDADSTDFEPLRDRCVYVWPAEVGVGVIDDESHNVMWMLQDELDAQVLTPEEFIGQLI